MVCAKILDGLDQLGVGEVWRNGGERDVGFDDFVGVNGWDSGCVRRDKLLKGGTSYLEVQWLGEYGKDLGGFMVNSFDDILEIG